MYKRRLQYLFCADGLRKFAGSTLAALGAIWLLIEVFSFFFPDSLSKGAGPFWGCLLFSVCCGTYRAFPRVRHSRTFRNMGIEIEVCVGDILSAGTDIAVVSSDYLDTCPDTISQTSIVGQLVQRYFRGVYRSLDEQIDASMLKQGIEGTDRPNKSTGKRKQYPIGTVAVVNLANRCAYLVVAAQMDANTVTVASADDLWVSLSELWKSIDKFGSQRPISLPIWGAGLTRSPTSSRTALFDLMVLSYIMHNRRHKVTHRLTIVVWGNEYRPDEFEHFIRTIDDLPL